MPKTKTDEIEVKTEEYKDITQAKENRTYDVDEVEIFKAGTWNGDSYTDDDIQEMENSYNEIGKQIKPFLKLGHNSEQKLLLSDGMPAAGWITNVRRKGSSLVADFKKIPKKIYELITNGAYGRMSSEIYWNLKANGKTYKRVLKAVALLGADTPAVQTLDDFINLYTENDFEYENIKDYHKIEDDTMSDELKIYQDKIADLESKLKVYAEIEKKNEELEGKVKEYSEKVNILETEKAKIYAEKKAEEVRNYLEKQVKEGKVLPAQVELYTKLSIEKDSFEMVKSIIESSEKQVDFSESSNDVQPDKRSDEEKMHEKALKYSEENKISYKEAMIIIEKEAE